MVGKLNTKCFLFKRGIMCVGGGVACQFKKTPIILNQNFNTIYIYI